MTEANKDGDGSQGGSAGSGNGTRSSVVYVDADVERIAARYGGKDQAIKQLFRDGKKARDKAAGLAAELATAVEAAKPKAGEIRLSGDDAKAYEAFTKLGKKPEEIATVLEEHGKLSKTVQATERRALHEKAAKAAGFANADALDDLATSKGLNIVLKTEKVNDKDTDVPYVQPAEQGAAPVRLTEYVDRNLAIYKPALAAQSAPNGAGGAADSARRTPHPDQQQSTATTPTKPNPLAGLREARVLPSQRNAKP